MSGDIKTEMLADIEEELRSGEYAPLADRIHAARQRERERWELAYGADHARDAMAYFATLFNRQPDPDWNAICAKCHDGEIEPDCEYYGEPNGCNSPIYGEHPTTEKSSAVGNAAAMREAIVLALSLLDLTEGVPYMTISQKDIDFIKAALSAPPRQCDVGTAEEQSKRLREFCKKHRDGIRRCSRCPVERIFPKDCTLAWAQMPYEEGKTDGSK